MCQSPPEEVPEEPKNFGTCYKGVKKQTKHTPFVDPAIPLITDFFKADGVIKTSTATGKNPIPNDIKGTHYWLENRTLKYQN